MEACRAVPCRLRVCIGPLLLGAVLRPWSATLSAFYFNYATYCCKTERDRERESEQLSVFWISTKIPCNYYALAGSSFGSVRFGSGWLSWIRLWGSTCQRERKETCLKHNFIIILMGRQLWRLATIPAGKNCVCLLTLYVDGYWPIMHVMPHTIVLHTTYILYYTFALERGHYSGARVSPAATPAYVRDLFQVISLSHIPAPLQHHIFMAS